MTVPQKTREHSVATFLVAVLALNPPILSIFSAEIFIFGIPLLYLYLFAVWAILIGIVAWIADWGERGEPPAQPDPVRDGGRPEG